MASRVFGRVFAADLKDPVTGKLFFTQGDVSLVKILPILDNAAVSKILVRSVLRARQNVACVLNAMDMIYPKANWLMLVQLLVLLQHNRLVNRVHSLL